MVIKNTVALLYKIRGAQLMYNHFKHCMLSCLEVAQKLASLAITKLDFVLWGVVISSLNLMWQWVGLSNFYLMCTVWVLRYVILCKL